MPSEEKKPFTLSGFMAQYRYAFTMIAMAAFALMLKLYAEDNLKLAYFALLVALSSLTMKTYLVQQNGDSIVKQIEQWLFEFGVILFISGFSSTSFNPVFSACALVFGVLFILIFLLLVMRKFFNHN